MFIRRLIFLQLLLVSTMLVGQVTEGLVAHYQLDGNATDASTYGNNGVVQGTTPTQDRFGNNNSALDFNGTLTDYITVGETPSLQLEQISFSTWVFLDGPGRFNLITKSMYDDATNEQFALSFLDSVFEFGIKRESSCLPGIGWQRVKSRVITEYGSWVFVVGTWDGMTEKIYFNGQLDSTNTNVPNGPIDQCLGSQIRIGRQWASDEMHLDGLLDDVRLFNRALSAVEIDTLYHLGGWESNVETVTDIDGNVYATVQIGTQNWMAENLKVTHYRDGSPITNITDNDTWGSLTTEAYCIYNNNTSNEVGTYGALYNWFAVEDSRNIAPAGWHVPTDDDWKELEMALGMSQSEADAAGYRGTNEGSKLAGNAGLWDNGELEGDAEFGSSGFNALPGGARSSANGEYAGLGSDVSIWTVTATIGDENWYRTLYYNRSDVWRYSVGSGNDGFAIRCIKDAITEYSGPVWHISTDGSDETGYGSYDLPFASIQFGIDASANGDTVLVQPGTYIENINFNGRNITVGSLTLTTGDTSYISSTIIDGNQAARVVTFNSGEDSTAVLNGFTVYNGYNSSITNPDFKGGGIYCENASPTFSNLRVLGNIALYGGGIYLDASNARIVDVEIVSNIGSYDGGGLYLNNCSDIHLENVTITLNNANGDGGNGYGGGIKCWQTNGTFNNVTIVQNQALFYGGGLYLDDSSPSLYNVNIANNSATYGGGICSRALSNPLFSNLMINDNSASENGGGVYIVESNPFIVNTHVINNIANGSGGGVSITSDSNPIIEDCFISGNSAWTGAGIHITADINPVSILRTAIVDNTAGYTGGGIYTNNSSANFVNVTIVNNIAGESNGGGLWCGGGEEVLIDIENAIIWGNEPDQIIKYDALSTINVDYSDIQGGYDGEANITIDPQFDTESEIGYNLTGLSPCIDAGAPDLDGDTETWETDPDDQDPDGTRMDMGAYYFHQENTSPLPPQNLTALPGNQQVILSWDTNSEDNFAMYRIFGDTTQAPTQLIDSTIAIEDTSITISSLSNGEIYYFRITAVDETGNESDFSNEVSATPVQQYIIWTEGDNGVTKAYDYNTNTWSTLSTPGNANGSFIDMTYDSESDRVIWVPGYSGNAKAYDYNTDTWENIGHIEDCNGVGFGLAYDVESDRVIWTKGYDGHAKSYDYNTNTWEDIASPGNSNGQDIAMAYDIESDRIIWTEGDNGVTKAYDYNTNTWSTLSTPGNANGSFIDMTYDSESDRVIWVPGYSGNAKAYDYNTDTWENIGHIEDCNGVGFGLAYDLLSDRVIWAAGNNGHAKSYDYNTNTWEDIASPGNSNGQDIAMTYIGAYDTYNHYSGPVWHVGIDGSDETGDGSFNNPFASIQNGIDVSQSGDTILVEPGQYIENPFLLDKDLTICSRFMGDADTSFIGNTVIDGNDNGNVIRVQDSRVTIIGLTITNGNDQRGGGINAVSDDLLSIQNCIISSNIATIDGGAIYHLQGPLELINTQVLNNESYTTGGGLTTMGDSVHIFDTQFIGNIANNAGGAIYDQNSILDIHESFFRNNSVVGQGGGLYAQGGQLSISSSSFENNLSSGAHAGAIYLGVSASFDSLIFRSNSAQQEGGALQVENGNTTIAHSLFFDNTAGSDGQAISLGETAGLDLQFCTLGENGVVPGSLVLFEDSNLQLSNSILWGNPGAEIVVLSSLNPCIMVIDYCDIENGLNGIDDQSGDLALTWGVGNLNVDPQFESDTTYALLNSSPCVDAGDPDYDGDGDAWDIDPDDQDPDGTRMDMGAYYYHQALAYVGPVWHVSTEGSDETGDGSEGSPFATIQFGIDASLSGDTVLVQPGTYLENINYTGKNILLGSLLLTTDDSTYIQQTVIDAGEAPNAVEFSSNEDSTAVLLGFTILNGALKGIFCENSSPSIRSCTISHSMRGIWCWASSPRINDVVVTNNDESGIWIGYESHPFITNSTISNNNGGGIHCTNYSNPTLVDVHIEGNHVSSGYGGGFFADNWCNPQLLRVKILANQADEGGGGIYVGQNSTVNLDSTLITNNYAPNQGGGIRVSLHGILIANRTEISSNSSNYDSGNYYGEPGSTVSLANCTVYGAGIYLQGLQEYSTVANYSNSILWVSSVHVESFTDMNVSFSVLQGGESGVTGDVSGSSFTSVIDDDPLFTDSAGGDLSLTGISPCIDAGDPGSPFDPDGTIADMGAYYYHQVPAYDGPVWHVSTAGSDETGDGSEGSPFASIQVGVNSANQSDTIQVGPGTFTADINIQSKSLHILGVDSASTIIAADVVYAQAHIQGQVVTYERLRFESNGTGGDYMAWAECTDCVGEDSILVQLRDVAADGSNEKGFLLTGQRTKLQISNSQFLNFYTQIASWNGSVFSLSKSNASFDHCAFSNNQSNGSGHVLYASDSSSVNINFSSFSGNGSSPGSIALADGSDLVLANSILWGTPNFQIVILDEGAACSVNTSYCDIANGILGIEDQSGNLVLNWGNGNINQLPQFVSVSDLSLQATSPCIDTGDPESPLDPDGTRADMGAYYFDQISNSPHITISSDFMSFTVNKAESFERSQTLTISNVGSLPLEVAISTDSIIVMDVDGNLYPTIQIGNQVWMAENLKVTHYRDGTAITNESDDDNWAALTTEAYCIYNNNAANEANLFGALYNWYAVEDTRNIAPEGWHVPTEAEWKELEVTLGMDVIEANTYGWRGTNEGSMLAGNENLWVEGDLVTNSQFAATDFNAIPGGLRPNNSGNYEFMGTHSYFWSSTAEGDFGWSRGLYYNYSFPGRTLDGKNNGFSIRCIKNLTTSQVDISVMKSNQVYNEADAIQNRSVPISETRWDNHQNWLTINHTSLSIQPGASSDVTVTVNAEGLDLGEYINNIVIFNNDPTRNIIEVPVSMRVISQDTIPPEIQLNVPDITAPLQNGDTLNVTWEASDNIALDWAKLFFTSNGGASFSLYDSVDANLGEVDWIAPDIIAGGCNFALWVSDQAGNISADTLAGNFSIDDGTLPTINILTPTLSSTVPEGDTLFVSWEASDNVGIEWFELWFSNQPSEPFSDIMQIPSTDTSFAFGVGEGVSDSARIKIVVLDLAANSAEAYSEYFAITDNTHPVISYFAIPDTTDWGIGSFMDISVVASDNVEVTGLDLNYSTDAGASWQTIIDDLYPVQGLPTYTWLVPDSPGECQIQAVIMDAVGLTDTSYSDVFSIFVEYPQMVASLHEIRPDGDMLIQFSQIMDSLDYMSGTQVVGSVHGLYEIEGSLSGYDLTLSAPEGFVSLDTLQLVLSSSSWTNSFGYSLDGNDDGIWGGNSEDNDTSFTVVTAAGDYDQNGILDFDDFDDFVIAWHNDVTEYELAPHQGEIPFINIQPDSSFDIYDLATFASMWNWAAGLSLSPPLTESFQYEEFISEQSGNELILSLPRSEYIASQTIIKYDPTIVQISVMDNELAKVSASSLSFVDVNPDSGFILITSSHLTGSNEDDLSLKLIPDTRHRYSIEIAFQGSDMDAEVVQKRSLVDLLPIPTSYSLSQNYPNPFNASTTIEYGLPKNTELNLSIYDIRGRFVREIYSGGKQAGYHITQWNGTNDGGRNVASGLYFIVLNTPEYRVARKALILK